MYIDESGIQKYIYHERGYAIRGQKIYGKISGKRYARINIIAAYCDHEIGAEWSYTGSIDASLFVQWVEKRLLPILKPGQIVVMDNATFHKSPEVKNLIESAKCTLLFLPPYSPQLNPIEKFWANFKQKLRNILQCCNNLEDAIQCALMSYLELV